MGNAPGLTTADRFGRIRISQAATKQPRRSVVSRLSDMFDKDAGGVAAVQHSANGTQRCLDLQKVLCAGRPLPARRPLANFTPTA